MDAISSISNMVHNMVWFYIKLNTRLIRGQVMHICVSELPIIGSDNVFSLGQHQAIIWTNDEILSTQILLILVKFIHFSFKKIHLKCHLENGGHFLLLRAEYRSAFELTKDMHLITHPWLYDFYDEYLRETAWEYGHFNVAGTYSVQHNMSYIILYPTQKCWKGTLVK